MFSFNKACMTKKLSQMHTRQPGRAAYGGGGGAALVSQVDQQKGLGMLGNVPHGGSQPGVTREGLWEGAEQRAPHRPGSSCRAHGRTAPAAPRPARP